jgi:hypothetical protein
VFVGEISLPLAETWPSVRKRGILRFKMNVHICIAMAKRKRIEDRERGKETLSYDSDNYERETSSE